MLFAARQAQTCAAGALPRHGWRPKGKQARQLYILQGLPNIGPERARRLLARFGSIEVIIYAPTKDLRSVEGIGKQIADKLRWSVEEPPYKYS
jgi:ERCC4-type nuclease